MYNKKIVFAGLARDCSKYLPFVLKNIELISKLFLKSYYVFVENGSIDNTKNILNNWQENHKEDTYLIDLNEISSISIRSLRLEIARNSYISFIKQKPDLANSDFLMVLDMDDSNIYEFKIEEFIRAFDFLEDNENIAAIFPNQIGTYYDLWALRHLTRCPNDIWEEVFDYHFKHNVNDMTAFNQVFANKIKSINYNIPPIKVDSAFGGFGIYKMSLVINNSSEYLGSKVKILINKDGNPIFKRWQLCEHVNFNLGIKNQGKDLYILPNLINGHNDGYTFISSAFHNMIF